VTLFLLKYFQPLPYMVVLTLYYTNHAHQGESNQTIHISL